MTTVRRPIDYAATRRWLATRYAIGTTADFELPDVLRGNLDADDVADTDPAPRTDLEKASWEELFEEFERSQLALLRKQPVAPSPQQQH